MADTQARADIGVTGLATMGRNLARNLARHDHVVAVHNRSMSKTDELMKNFADEGDFVPAEDLAGFVASLKKPRTAIILVKAGDPTDAVIDALADLMEDGDIIVDAGNAHFKDTRRREKALRDKGLNFVGSGVSGGEEGALNGPSIMPGGSAEAYETVGPMLEAIAAKADDGSPCCVHVGPDGAGHFVKMVHNGIEYSDMQLIAESYDLLRTVVGMDPAEIAAEFERWNEGDLDSYLIQITAEVLKHTDAETGMPFVDIVQDQAEQKGTGRWTVQAALDLGIPVTGIAEATFARALSGHAEQRAKTGDLPGPDGAKAPDGFAADISKALYASKIVAYAQGFDQIIAGSEEYDWDVDPGAMAAIWRNGCIIRARFLDRIKQAYADDPQLVSLLVAPTFADTLAEAQDPWRRVVSTAAAAGVPTPGFSSALAYYDGLRRDRLPAALIQGLRDYFGAHTYRRVDKDGVFHTMWAEDDQQEVSRD